MKKDIKSIQGQQLLPNLPGPECIRVTKVYDWVVLTNRDRNKIPIPEECFAQIENCRHQGNSVTASCSEVPGTRTCDFVGSTPANIGVPGARVVTLAFHVHIRIQFFCNGSPLPGCNFVVPVSFVDDVILCFPEGTEINCNIFDVQCSVLLNQMLGNMVVIDVIMCKDVQVEAEVKLEVEAKFCGPRPVIPMEDDGFTCQTPTFPQQCPDLFPPDNCECQGEVDLEDFVTTILVRGATVPTAVSGSLDLTALICDQCSLANSRLEAEFTDFPQPSPSPLEEAIDQSFTFRATQFNPPTCVPDLLGVVTTLTVTGTGVYQQAGQAEQDATFLAILDDATDTVSLTIFVGGVPVAVIASLLVPEASINVGNCEQLT